MKTLYSLILTLFFIAAAHAGSYKCDGTDSDGKPLHVVYNEDAMTLTVNGDVLKVVAPTKGKNGVATEDYDDTDGTKTYISLVTEGKDKIVYREMRSKDDKELEVVNMNCD